jgi:hypothetical protein
LPRQKAPCYFFHGREYRPEIGKTGIKINDEGRFSHVLVSHEERLIFELFYEKKFGIGLHPYSNERKDVDFHYWLDKNLGSSKFYLTYKRDIKFIDQDED